MFKVNMRLAWVKAWKNTVKELSSTFNVSRDFARLYLQPALTAHEMCELMNAKNAIDCSIN